MIEFKPETHQYFLEGRELTPVTTLLQNYGLAPKFFSQQAAKKGTFIHKAIHLYLLDNLNENSLDPIIKPYFESFKKWFLENEPEVREAEYRLGSLLLGFAGTLDFIGIVGEELLLIDWKTGQKIIPSHWLQLEMYRRLVSQEEWAKEAKVAILHLPKGELIRPDEKQEKKAKEIVEAIIKIEVWKSRLK